MEKSARTCVAMTSYYWCNLCYCSASSINVHYRGKKHRHRSKKISIRLGILPEILKFKIISYLYDKVIDHRSLFREIHIYNMDQCHYEIVMLSPYTVLCKLCKMPRDTSSYDKFMRYLSKNEMCIDCAFHVVTRSNFLSDLCLSIHENRIKLIPEQLYHSVHTFNRFERVTVMLRSLQQFYNRNNFTIPMFDITLISSFWSVHEFLSYIYYTSCNYLHVIHLFSTQRL